MTKIAISSYDAASLASARRAGESRKYIWQRIRAQFGIPANIRLGMATDRTLFVAKSDPRQFLYADSNGRYSYTASDDARMDRDVSVSAPAFSLPELSDAVRFVTAQGTGGRAWGRIAASDLQDALQDSAAGDDDVDLPDGFPVDTKQDVVFDTATGDVYFRV